MCDVVVVQMFGVPQVPTFVVFFVAHVIECCCIFIDLKKRWQVIVNFGHCCSLCYTYYCIVVIVVARNCFVVVVVFVVCNCTTLIRDSFVCCDLTWR